MRNTQHRKKEISSTSLTHTSFCYNQTKTRTNPSGDGPNQQSERTNNINKGVKCGPWRPRDQNGHNIKHNTPTRQLSKAPTQYDRYKTYFPLLKRCLSKPKWYFSHLKKGAFSNPSDTSSIKLAFHIGHNNIWKGLGGERAFFFCYTE